MEKRINKKIEGYLLQMKDNIKDKISTLGLSANDDANDLLQYIYDYDRMLLTKDDFLKRKRVKNAVNLFDRCCAKRANGEQCTRRKRGDDAYCGTHSKGTPHGIIENKEGETTANQSVEVWAQDIQGILYYIDKAFNVYQAEDIVTNKLNPKVIAKYVKNGESYSIPAFGL